MVSVAVTSPNRVATDVASVASVFKGCIMKEREEIGMGMVILGENDLEKLRVCDAYLLIFG